MWHRDPLFPSTLTSVPLLIKFPVMSDYEFSDPEDEDASYDEDEEMDVQDEGKSCVTIWHTVTITIH